MDDEAIQDRRSLERRLEMLRLPVVALRRGGRLLIPRDDADWERVPRAVGVSPDQQMTAVWNCRRDPRRRLVTVHDGGAPDIFDCYALNVTGETAWTCAFTDFHLVSAQGDRVTDHGPAPHQGAHLLLVDGPVAALVGRPGPEYDLITVFGQPLDRPPRRLVQPDGMELRITGSAGRGPELHIVDRISWYRTDLDQLTQR